MILMAATPGFEEYVLEGLAKIFPGVPVFGGSAAHDLDGSTGNGGQLFVVGTEQVLDGPQRWGSPTVDEAAIRDSAVSARSLPCASDDTSSCLAFWSFSTKS